MGSVLGGSSTTENTIPDWVRGPAERNLGRAEEISQIGYVPYMGPEVAAFNGQQNAAFQNTNDMASAFGMSTGSGGMPAPETFAGGMQGYSSAPLYEQSLQALQQKNPAQYDAIMSQFIDPVNGGMPQAESALTTGQQRRHWLQDSLQAPEGLGGGGYGDHGYGGPSASGSGGFGGYSGIGDMFDGGGAGNSGGAFSGGGPASVAANAATGGGAGGGGIK